MADDREEIAEAARTVVEGVADASAELLTAEAALEAAEERAEAAEEIAEQLAEAALRDTLGRSIADLRGEVEQWRATQNQQVESLMAENQNLAAQVASLRTALDELKANQAPAPQAVILPSSTPESSGTPAEAIVAEIVEPTQASAPVAAPVVLAPAAQRRGRWI